MDGRRAQRRAPCVRAQNAAPLRQSGCSRQACRQRTTASVRRQLQAHLPSLHRLIVPDFGPIDPLPVQPAVHSCYRLQQSNSWR